MINTACPKCHNIANGQGAIFRISKKQSEVYEICRCAGCGMVYTRFDHEVSLKELYDENDYTVRDTRNSVFFRIQKWEYNRVINKIKLYTGLGSPTIIDFGAGKGLFLHFARLRNCIVKGIESSVPRAEYARKIFDLDINTDYYRTGNVFGLRVDALTSFHVFEHLDNPGELLSELIEHNLKDGGVLVIEVPNFDSWQSRWAGSNWLHLDVPRHIGHFTDATLSAMIAGAGCTIIRKEYFSAHLGIIGMVQTIFSWFGYRGFLIAELKTRKNPMMLVALLLALPFAIILELCAAMFSSGGVLRYYAVKSPSGK